MHFIYKYLFKSFDYIVHLGTFNNNRFLLNIVINKAI